MIAMILSFWRLPDYGGDNACLQTAAVCTDFPGTRFLSGSYAAIRDWIAGTFLQRTVLIAALWLRRQNCTIVYTFRSREAKK